MQWFKQVVNHVGAGTEVVVNLVNIIDLHGFEGHRNLPCTVEFKDLVAGESITGHTTRAIGKVDLQILIDPEMIVFRSLRHNLFGRPFVNGWLGANVLWLWSVVGNDPEAINLCRVMD